MQVLKPERSHLVNYGNENNHIQRSEFEKYNKFVFSIAMTYSYSDIQSSCFTQYSFF
jgi:hypothetical protein